MPVNPVSIYVEIAFAAILVLLGAVGGYFVADYFAGVAIKDLNKQLTQAKADTAVAVAAVNSTRSALGTLKGKLDDLQARHDAMRALSQAELDARGQRIEQLEMNAAKRQSVIVEKSRDPTCADLARLPVCGAVAGQLWPAATAPGSGEPAGNH